MPKQVDAQALYGRGTLSFEDYRYDIGGEREGYYSLNELLNLDLDGLLNGGRLAKYHTGISLLNSDIYGGSKGNDIFGLGYNLSSTLLPQRSFPLTLYARQNIKKVTGDYYPPQDVRSDQYGLGWTYISRGSLPKVFLDISQLETESRLGGVEDRRRWLNLGLFKAVHNSGITSKFSYDDYLNKLNNYRYTQKYLFLDDLTQLPNNARLQVSGSLSQFEARNPSGDTSGNNRYSLKSRFLHYPTSRLMNSYAYKFFHYQMNDYQSLRNSGSIGMDCQLEYGLKLTNDLSGSSSKTTTANSTSRANSVTDTIGLGYGKRFRRFNLYSNYDYGYGWTQVDPGESGGSQYHRLNVNLSRLRTRWVEHTTQGTFSARRDKISSNNNWDNFQLSYQLASFNIRDLALSNTTGYSNRATYEPNYTRTQSVSSYSQANWRPWRRVTLNSMFGYYYQSMDLFSSSSVLYSTGIAVRPIRRMRVNANLKQKRGLSPATNRYVSNSVSVGMGYGLRQTEFSMNYSYSSIWDRSSSRFFVSVSRSFGSSF